IGLPETELVAVRVAAGREPAHLRDRHRIVGLAAELLHPRGACVDVVDAEVRPRALLARLHGRDRAARRLADPRHVVLPRSSRELLELPAEQPAPEGLRLPGVVRGDLDVNHLAGHTPSLLVGVLPTLRTPKRYGIHRCDRD